MRNKNVLFMLLVLIMCFLVSISGCAVSSALTTEKMESIGLVETKKEMPTLIPSSTPTPSPTATVTHTPTNTPLPSPTPTPTLERAVENDLNPSYIQTVYSEFMGVKFNLELISDSSLSPDITKITVSEDVFTELIARNIFRIWWDKGLDFHEGETTEDDFMSFMNLWSKAQETNEVSDWEKVQINEFLANDLNDGLGFVYKPYNMWFMYEGEPHEGITAIKIFSVAMVHTSEMVNMTNIKGLSKIEERFDIGFGSNLNGYKLLIYLGSNYYKMPCGSPDSAFYCTPLNVIRNIFKDVLVVEPNGYVYWYLELDVSDNMPIVYKEGDIVIYP